MPRRQALGVGDEEVVADELDAVADALGQRLPAVPVLLVHAVLDREDRVACRRARPSRRPARRSSACGPRARARRRRRRRSRSSPGPARSRRPPPACSPRPRCPRRAAAAPPRWSRGRARSRPRRRPPSPSPRSCSVFLSAWKTSVPIRSASANDGAPTGTTMNSWKSTRVVGVGAAVEDVHHRHRQHVRGLAAEVAPQRQALLGGAPRARRPARRRGSRWRRGATCSACRRGRSARGRAPPGRSRRCPSMRLGDLAVDVGRPPSSRPCRPSASPPSRSSMASNSPVDAPDGTAARPGAPERRTSSTSTVGLPRESRIWRAWTFSIWLMDLVGFVVQAPERAWA